MTQDSDSTHTLKLSNAARMVINAIATETGPLVNDTLFIEGCALVATLSALPNVMQVGETSVDIPRALHSVESKAADDVQRIGVEQLAMQWRALPCEVTLTERQLTVLRLQLMHILANQGSDRTQVKLTLTPNCAEAVKALTEA